jgi:hypothetical protein
VIYKALGEAVTEINIQLNTAEDRISGEEN